MSAHSADRNLLFGMLAHLNGFLTRSQLVELLHAWVLDKSRPLGELAVGRGDLSDADRGLIEALVERHLSQHEGDAQASLAAVSSGAGASLPELRSLADADLQRSLGALAEAENPAAATTELIPGKLDAPTATWEGDVLTLTNRYRVLRAHARGGLGDVSLARDEVFDRRIAVKKIQEAWIDNDQARARFLVEAEITGGLDHPFIVPIHGLGFDRSNRPFYAMRFIDGRTLKTAIDEFHGSLTQARPQGQALVEFQDLLGRIVQIGQAVHYAHERGVVHRDIKPSNIMLGKHGETMLVDWGLAKVEGRQEEESPGGESALRPSSGSGLEPTQPGRAIGTYEYMPPEQAEGRLDAIDPRSDVYALGATLHYLLAGRPQVEEADVAERIRKISTGAITPPRQAVKSPRARVKLDVPKPLESICRRAMALQPVDRYPTALELVGELKQYLAREPVAAYRENRFERLQRWGRKHRTAVTTLGALLAAGLLGATGFALVLDRKNRELDQRNLDLRNQVEATQKAESLADARLDRAMAAIRDYYSGFSEEALKAELVPKSVRERLLEKPLAFYEELTAELNAKANPSAREQALLAEGRLSLGSILMILGRGEEARSQFEAAITLCETLVAAEPGEPQYRHGLANSYLNLGHLLTVTGEGSAARTAIEKAIAGYEELAATRPDVPSYLSGLAQSYTRLGMLHHFAGRGTASHEAIGEAIRLFEKLVAEQPGEPEHLRMLSANYVNLSLTLRVAGELEGAREAIQNAIERVEALVASKPAESQYQSERAAAYGNLAILMAEKGDAAAARSAFETACALSEALAAVEPGVPHHLHVLSGSYSNLGTHLRKMGERTAARDAFAKAVARGETLVAAQPGIPEFQSQLALGYLNFGNLLRDMGEHAAAREAYEKASAQFKALVTEQPDVPDYLDGLARSCGNLGFALQEAGDVAAARALLEKAIAQGEALVAAQPDVPDYQDGLALNYINLGSVLRRLGQDAAARAAIEKSIALSAALVAAQPGGLEFREHLALGYMNSGKLLSDTGEHAAAREAYEKASAQYEALVTEQPNVPDYLNGLARSYGNLGLVLKEVGELAAARAVHQKAIGRYEALLAQAPGTPDYLHGLALNYGNLGSVLAEAGQLDDARDAFLKAIATGDDLVTMLPNMTTHQKVLAFIHGNFGNFLRKAGEGAAAREACEKAVALFEVCLASQPGDRESERGLAGSYHNLGTLFREAGEGAAAQESYQKAIARFEALERQPGMRPTHADLAASYSGLGTVLKNAGNAPAARKAFEKAVARYEALLADRPGVLEFQDGLAGNCLNLGAVLLGMGEGAAARERLEEAVAGYEALVAAQPDTPLYRDGLAISYTNLGTALLAAGEGAAALELFQKGIVQGERLVAEKPNRSEYREGLAQSYGALGFALRTLNEHEEALAAFQRVREIALPGSHLARLVAQWIPETEALVASGARLEAIVRGEDAPKDNTERLTLAQRAYETKQHRLAVRLWTEAFNRDPRVAEDQRAPHRYNAACAAVLAASDGEDSGALRAQALEWLRAELEACNQQLARAARPNPIGRVLGAPDRASIQKRLQWWTEDPDFVSVRGEAIEGLPADEREGWRALWAEVERVRMRAAGNAPADADARDGPAAPEAGR